MNVMVVNKYKEMLMGLNIEVMKSIEGVFNVDEIIDTFTNFYYDKMILDITAIRDYQNSDNLQKLAMNINMENVILLLDDNPESDSKSYLSKLISLGIYNFTRNAEGINYLLVHPHTYKDVVNIHNLQDLDAITAENNGTGASSGGKLRIIGFKNMTLHAGSTTLIYMMRKLLSESKLVSAIEVNKVDFLYFNDKELVSTTSSELPKELMKKQMSDIILVDLNDYDDISICSQVYYLIEPSTIMINKMLRKNKNVLEQLKNEKIVLNKCVLNSEDIATFEYETKLKVFFAIPPVDDRQNDIAAVRKFISKIGL
jgi:hypothetical protein